jgi:hypothetical protein
MAVMSAALKPAAVNVASGEYVRLMINAEAVPAAITVEAKIARNATRARVLGRISSDIKLPGVFPDSVLPGYLVDVSSLGALWQAILFMIFGLSMG